MSRCKTQKSSKERKSKTTKRSTAQSKTVSKQQSNRISNPTQEAIQQTKKTFLYEKMNTQSPFLRSENLPKNITISQSFHSKTFVCTNTNACVNCIDCDNTFVYVGLKSDSKPFNIFEKKTGKSTILILDLDLCQKDRLEFEFGDLVQLKCDLGFLYALFSNGYLIKIDPLKSLNGISFDDVNRTPHTSLVHKQQSIIFDIIENNHKATAFDVKNGNIVFTDGSIIICNNTKKIYDGIVLQVQIHDAKFILLDINGKVVITDFEMKEFSELTARYTITGIQLIENVLVVSDGSIHTLVFPFDTKEQADKINTFNFFVGNEAGVVEHYKRVGSRRTVKGMFQILRKGGTDTFTVRTDKFESDSECYIPRVITEKDYFLFCTEDGLVVKVFYVT